MTGMFPSNHLLPPPGLPVSDFSEYGGWIIALVGFSGDSNIGLTSEKTNNIYRQIFEIELDSWSTNKDTWPKKRSYALFRKWFEIEFHSEVLDFGIDDIEIGEY